MNVCAKKIKKGARAPHIAGGEVDIDSNLRQTAIRQSIKYNKDVNRKLKVRTTHKFHLHLPNLLVIR
jgi:hypothetical protein